MYEPKFATKTLTKRALILLIVIYHSILPRKSKNMYLHLVVYLEDLLNQTPKLIPLFQLHLVA